MSLEICQTAEEMSRLREGWRNAGLKTGLVPTMGALHEGHLSLVAKISPLVDRTIVSLFVNPTQFAEGEDFRNYPRTEQEDVEKLETTAANAVFVPTAKEVYGDDMSATISPGSLAAGLESDTRPHFFGGVVTVVHRLFELCRPDRAIFGEKDYQQLLVIKQMVRENNLDTDILSGPTIREKDGLAMSSRNAYLDASQRKTAASLNRIMRELCDSFTSQRDLARLPALEGEAANRLLAAGFSGVDYFTVREAETLGPATEKSDALRLLAAARLGDIRLIDNMPLS